jgi:hypothetical protein
MNGEPDNWVGPPYSVVEHVFDEYDFAGLYATREEFPETWVKSRQ